MTWWIWDDDIYVSIEEVSKEECMGGRGFQVKISKSKDTNPLGTEVHPSTGLARNFCKWENHVFSYCFTTVMSF